MTISGNSRRRSLWKCNLSGQVMECACSLEQSFFFVFILARKSGKESFSLSLPGSPINQNVP